jgi:molybdate transport system ATP-binding protein
MDEPLAALDAQRKAEVLPYLERLQRELDIPVIYVSHAIDEVARLAEHLVLLEAGHALASGPTQTMLTRLDLPLARGDSAAAVIAASVSGHDSGFGLSYADFAGGHLTLAQPNLPLGQTLRLRIQARDVSLTLQRQTDTSILNILRATVTELAPDSPGQVMLRLDVGGCLLLARVSAKSVDALHLAPGQAVYAQIKGVAIVG